MLHALDRNRPYAEVHGLPGAYWSQDGINFKYDGSEALDVSPIVEELPIEQEEIIPAVCCIEMPSLPAEVNTTGRNIEDMPSRHLKALVESYGEQFTTRKEAIKLMKGKKINGASA